MESMKDKAAIVGVGYTPQGRVPGRSGISFHVQAALHAIEDAGLSGNDIDGLLCQPVGGVWPAKLAEQLGLHLRFGAGLNMAGASAGVMLHYAAMAVAHGLANNVLCTYGDNPTAPRAGWERPYGGGQGDAAAYGMFGAVGTFALVARRAMHELGTGPETWAEVALAQRAWANLNPRAVMYQRPLTVEDYFNSRWQVEPLRLLDCCLVTDGGRAFLVTSAERARDLRQRPVYLMGMAQDHPSVSFTHPAFSFSPSGAGAAGEEAFQMAGITRGDVDACEVTDIFTFMVDITLMSYGFFGPGQGGDFVRGARLGPGGGLPVNTSGGLLSEANQGGFTLLTEAVVQLRGTAGERQLGVVHNTKQPDIILVGTDGGVFQTHTTTLLRR